MGGRGASAIARGLGGGGGGGGNAFTITQNANGGATITPTPQQPANAQQLTGGGSGVSDANTHTTYFTPADRAIVGPDNTDGYRVSARTGKLVPVGYYQTGDYYNVNTELRNVANGKQSKLSPQTQKVVDAMDRNMRPLNKAQDSERWTDMAAISDNLGMPGASKKQIISALSQNDITRTKTDYTSSSWDTSKNVMPGAAGRYVKVKMHYAQGALVQYSPTRKEGEMVGARNKPQRFSHAREERMRIVNPRTGKNEVTNVLVVDCYVDQ